VKRWLALVAVLALFAAVSGGVSAAPKWFDGATGGGGAQTQGFIRPGGTWQ